MIIKCSKGNSELEFSEPEGLRSSVGSEYFRVTITSRNLAASSQVYAFDPINNGLKLFFDDLSANWKGWNGERKWSSLEGELSFVCTTDSLGHVEIEVMLENVWSVKNVFFVDAGQLQQIASDVRKFFSI